MTAALKIKMEHGALVPELTPQCLGHIFSHLTSRDVERAICVQKLWLDLIIHDEHLWNRHLTTELGLSDKQGADGQTKQTYREAYASWRRAFSTEYWPYLRRAIGAWTQIKTWLASNMPEILTSLRAGLSEAEVAEVESQLGFVLPPALKVMYRLHDGQSLVHDDYIERTVRRQRAAAAAAPAGTSAAAGGCCGGGTVAGVDGGGSVAEEGDLSPEEEEARAASIFRGMFGGYGVYEHRTVSRMLPLRRAAWLRCELERAAAEASRRVQLNLERSGGGREAGGGQRWRAECERRAAMARAAGMEPREGLDRLLPLACSFDLEDRFLMADVGGGGMALARSRLGGWDLRAAVPPADTGDGPLRWLEEYGRRLAAGCYQPAPLDESYPALSRIISLYPLVPQYGMVEAITRGVRVRASVVYVPEAHLQGGRHMLAYSIRFSLAEGAPFARCQLTHRHWVIRDENGNVTDRVNGEGVIGLYPLLEPGQQEFVYCSCTTQTATRGSMEGEFDFVPGSIEQPEGPPFSVVCPTFRLDIPPYIF